MNNGMYRASSVEAVSMEAWLRLNFDEIPRALIAHVNEYPWLLRPVDVELPDEPERDDYDNVDEFDTAYTKWEEEVQIAEDAMELPMWGTMWVAEDSNELAKDLIDCGFTVYRPDEGILADCYEGRLLFGVNGAGYSFYGAHWIPLRATRLARAHANGYLGMEVLEDAVLRLIGRLKEEGDYPDKLQGILSTARALEAEGGDSPPSP